VGEEKREFDGSAKYNAKTRKMRTRQKIVAIDKNYISILRRDAYFGESVGSTIWLHAER
jgi:hypothetical protein